ncbi:MAG: hypothetical protein Tp1109DCM542121_50 [Prokaryotic dsDNA virus sp.]|nr:MAG: hypothetical protein Tp1109DCM542121_50 [Prokaryotic dsDNA virus sp.]|tara:strand:+ start:28778 stop:29350 length:573 start_codon:yes stop_codon:yes gene_type:complete
MAFAQKTFSQTTFGGLGINPDVVVVPTGLSATGSVSQPAVVGEGEFAVTGQFATGQVGTVTVAAAADVSVTLAAMTGSVGDESVVEGTGVTVSATGVAGTGTLGNEVAAASANVLVTGVSSTVSVGTVNQASVYKLTGVSATGQVGQPTLWTRVITGQDPEPVYNDVDENTSNSWAAVSTPSSNWNEVRP